jgi:hypothetical protein
MDLPHETTKAAPQTQLVGSQSNAWAWTLSVPRNVRVELRIAGNVTLEDIKRLKKQIEFLEESFEDGQVQ